MGLIGKGIQAGVWATDFVSTILDRPLRVHFPEGESLLPTEGPDDTWPEDDYVAARLSIDVPAGGTEPEILVGQQWGLQLPNGEIHWNTWQGVIFHHPIDRLQMVAKLHQTALVIGLAGEDQLNEFLSKYQWVTRNQIASVVYEETGSYPLTHPQVSALGTPEDSDQLPHEHDQGSADDNLNLLHPDLAVRQGSVGGDAS